MKFTTTGSFFTGSAVCVPVAGLDTPSLDAAPADCAVQCPAAVRFLKCVVFNFVSVAFVVCAFRTALFAVDNSVMAVVAGFLSGFALLRERF